jgi:scavenger receptor class B protein 1
MSLNNTIKIRVLLAFGLLLIVTSIIVYFAVPLIIRAQIGKALVIADTDSSKTYPNWKTLPIPIYNSFYLFNITNVNEVLKLEEPPHVQQIGPYVFRESRTKVNLIWTQDDTQVTYEQVRAWHFVPSMTNGSLDDIVYNVNVPMVSAGATARKLGGQAFVYLMVNGIVKGTKSVLFPRHTVSELLFEGYSDKLITAAKRFFPVPYDKFGWFYGRNDTSSDGNFTISTGKSLVSSLGKLNAWNNHSQLWMYRNSCMSLDDVSAGDFQRPLELTTPSYIKIYVGDICRPLKLNYERSLNTNGFRSNRYTADDSLFDYYFEENRCFCPSRGCPPNGVANTTACPLIHGAPAAISLPHFLYGDPVLTHRVRGLNPDPKVHDFYMDIEPTLGIATDVGVKMQINIVLEKDKHLDFAKNMTVDQIYFPMIWFSATAKLDPEMTNQLRMLTNLPFYINLSSVVILCLGIGLILFNLIWFRNEIYISKVPPNEV